MICPSCQGENRPGRKFCAQCGTPLAVACPSCGAANEPGERFCGECGKPLSADAPPSRTPTPSPSAALPASFADGRYTDAHDKEPKELMSEMGPGAADIAQVVSEVKERLPGLPAPPALEPDQARFRLVDSITTFLKNAPKAAPLMVVLDDMHWADKPSLLLLQFLAKDLR